VKVSLSKRARRDARRINTRWSSHGDHPRLFAEELLDALRHLRDVPHAGTPKATARRPKLNRLLMEKSKCHIYFEVDEKRGLINVITVWNAQRGREPNL
jgi:plasmid stabilization system protein ParE